MKSWLGITGVLLPVLYCAGLLYYFLDLSGSVAEAEAIGLGPTVLGLGAVGVLLSIPLILKTIRIVTRSRRQRGDHTEPGFDADAVIARYAARQEPAPPAAANPPARGSQPARGFGRRTH